ncbi:MAG TPA: efflux RND transporter periplasmic adaptor subunit [Longimicrobiales bacterium]|nr:efflux RND transporter periplasmic adaptor subunit [Longimicrobiales bacterium]
MSSKRLPASGPGARAAAICLVLLQVLAACDGERATTIEIEGTIEADQVLLGAPFDARVAEVRVDEGAAVTAGQVLAVLEQPSVTGQLPLLRAQVDSARTRLQELETAAASGEPLRLPEQLVSAEAVQEQRTRVRGAEAALAAAELMDAMLVVTAPITGIVQHRAVDPDTTVDQGTLLFRIARVAQPYLRARVPASLANRLRPGARATVRVDALGDRTFSGVVARVGDAVHDGEDAERAGGEQGGSGIEVRIELENPGELLIPGMSAHAEIATGEIAGDAP